jgi:hypothetical protein
MSTRLSGLSRLKFCIFEWVLFILYLIALAKLLYNEIWR